MNKNDFFNVLIAKLSDCKESDVQNLLTSLDEKFYSEMKKGKTEQEVISSLGNPYDIADSFLKGTYYINKRFNTEQNINNTALIKKPDLNNKKEYSDNADNKRANVNNNSFSELFKDKNFDINKCLKIAIIILLASILFPIGKGVCSVMVFFMRFIAKLPTLTAAAVYPMELSSFYPNIPISSVILFLIGSASFSLIFIILFINVIRYIIQIMRNI